MKYRNRLVWVVLLLCMLASGACAEQLTCIVREGQYVNVRNQPYSRAATWGVMHTGEVIDTDPAEIKNGFLKRHIKTMKRIFR